MIDQSCKEWAEFCEKHGDVIAEDVLSRLCDIAWNSEKTDGVVTITDRHQHNASNHTYSGYVELNGEHFDFVIDNGDWAGTVVAGWGDNAGVYEPPEPTRWMMVPIVDAERAWKIWDLWRKEAWFTAMIGKYSYDRHFQPGTTIESCYRDKAAKLGMKFVDLDTAKEAAKRFGIKL